MKRLMDYGRAVLAVVLIVLSFSSCEKEIDVDNNSNDALYKEILGNYVNTTVVPTYQALAEAALEMRAANRVLKADPTDANMKTASEAWMKARIWWEKSEAFLFGPVGENAFDIDAHIDSWPLELDAIKQSIDKEGGNITSEKAWGELDAEEIGFHVTEYLLFREGQSRLVSDLSPAELNYLTAATDALVWDCVLAYVAWVGEENVSEDIKIVFHENDAVASRLDKVPYYKNFADKLRNAESGYASFAQALTEIPDGAADIAGEVGETKIAAPFATGKTEEVESWYSWHSLDDYQNNIYSIKNAYLGGVDDKTRTSVSLSTYVAKVNPQLDKNIKAKIEESISKIAAIGGGTLSFYEVVRDHVHEDQVNAAVEACIELEGLFGQLSGIIE
jgi:uncharacterized iron-regulated protein